MRTADQAGQRKASEILAIDQRLAFDRLCSAIREEAGRTGGILLGCSGGLDSALLALISVRAVGPDKVRLYYLFDQFSSPLQRRHVEHLATWLGAVLVKTSIEMEMRRQGVYSTAGMRLTSISANLNRILIFLFRMFLKDLPFQASLKVGDASSRGRRLKELGLLQLIQQPEQGMNLRHRYRRKVLEDAARRMDWSLLGAANRTEWLTGWFVKDGVDDLPIQPLIGLYKTQIRDMASFLGMPAAIVSQTPSPDMLPGITDQVGLGLPYWKIDIILDALASGHSDLDYAEVRITSKDVNHVQRLVQLSAWKRSRREVHHPVDGGPDGDLRMRNAFHG